MSIKTEHVVIGFLLLTVSLFICDRDNLSKEHEKTLERIDNDIRDKYNIIDSLEVGNANLLAELQHLEAQVKKKDSIILKNKIKIDKIKNDIQKTNNSISNATTIELLDILTNIEFKP